MSRTKHFARIISINRWHHTWHTYKFMRKLDNWVTEVRRKRKREEPVFYEY